MMLRWIYFLSFVTGAVPASGFLFSYGRIFIKNARGWTSFLEGARKNPVGLYLVSHALMIWSLYMRALILNIMAPRVAPSNLAFSLITIWLFNSFKWWLFLMYLRERRAGRL